MAFIVKSDAHRIPVISNPSQSNLDKWLWSCDEMEQDKSEDNMNIESATCNGSSKQHSHHSDDKGDEYEDIDHENQSIRANNPKTSSNLKMTIAFELDKLKSNPKLQSRHSIAGNTTSNISATPASRIKAKQTESSKKDPEVERLREEVESLKLQLSKRTPMSHSTASTKNTYSGVNENNDNKTVATSSEAGSARLWKTIEELRKENVELKTKTMSLSTSLTKKDHELESIKARYAAIKKENERLQKQVGESEKKKIEIDDQQVEPIKNSNRALNVKTKVVDSHLTSKQKQNTPPTPVSNQRNEFAQNEKIESFSPPPPPPTPPMAQRKNDSSISQPSASSNPLNTSNLSVESAFSSISSIKDIQLPPSRAPPSPPRSSTRNINNKSIKNEIETPQESAANKLLAITKEQKSTVSEIPLSLVKPSADAERKRKVTMVNGELMVNTDQGLVRLSDWVRSTANVGSS